MNVQIKLIFGQKKTFLKAENNLNAFIESLIEECDIELKDNEQVLLKTKQGKIIKDNDGYLQYINDKKKEFLNVEIIEKEKLEKLKQEQLEKEKLEKLKKEQLEKEKLEKLKKEQLEKERLEKLKKEKLEKERLEKLKKEQLEKERLEKLKQEQLEKERVLGKKNENNLNLNKDEDTIEKIIDNNKTKYSSNPIEENFNEKEIKENGKENINSDKLLNEIEKILEKKIKVINDKIEEEKKDRKTQLKEINEKIDTFTNSFNQSIKQIETKFIYLEKKMTENKSVNQNNNKSNNELFSTLLNQISKDLNEKIKDIKNNLIPQQFNNISNTIEQKNNILQNQINTFINSINSNISNKKNQNQNIGSNYVNNNYFKDFKSKNNNFDNYDNDTNKNYNPGLNQHNINRKFINIDTDKGDISVPYKDDLSGRKRGYNVKLMLSKNKIKTKFEDLKSNRTRISIEIKNLGNAPLPNTSYLIGEGDNLTILKTPLNNTINDTDSINLDVILKNNNPQKIEKMTISLYDPNDNKLDECIIEIEIIGKINSDFIYNQLNYREDDDNNFNAMNNDLMRSMNRRSEFREKLEELKGFFTDKDEEELINALNKFNNDVNLAITYLMEN